jgi:enterochelin esterase-like enzyme
MLLLGAQAWAQVATELPAPVAGAKPVTVDHITIHGTALEENLEGNAVDRDVIIFLPPEYSKNPRTHYPVRQMIVVLPDSKTRHNGSMYSSSVTTGDFEQFIARDVVKYIDTHYRTIPSRLSRGLAGHSMGGYGATRIGMKYPDVFGSLYIMSPCCLAPREPGPEAVELEKAVENAHSPADLEKLPFFPRATLASAAAWSPNPHNPPLYLDLPTKGGVTRPDIAAKWAANAPLAFMDQYIANLRQYRAIALDVGDQDGLRVDTTKLHTALDEYAIPNSFEVYSGTHTSAVADRFQNHVVPFFSEALCFSNCR